MKKIILMGVIVLMALFSAVPVYAIVDGENASTQAGGGVRPLYTYISALGSTLLIDSSGLSTSIGEATLYNGTNTVTLTVQLQKFNGVGWTTLKTWSGTGAGIAGAYVEEDYYVARGIYRVYSKAQVYSNTGQLLETQSVYSPSRTY